MNIQMENVHQYNSSCNTGNFAASFQNTLVFVPKPMSSSILWKRTVVFHMWFHCKEMLQAACALSVQILRKYREWLRPTDATGTGLGVSYAKSSLAIQCCVPVPTQCLHKPMSCQSSFHSADEEWAGPFCIACGVELRTIDAICARQAVNNQIATCHGNLLREASRFSIIKARRTFLSRWWN